MNEQGVEATEPAGAATKPRRHWRWGAAVAVALAVALVAWLLLKGDGDSSQNGSRPEAKAASVQDLQQLPAALGHPVYWVGARSGYTYELTRVAGRVYIRYLPQGVKPGDQRPSFLSVGTYEVRNAYSVLNKLSKKSGISGRLPKGGIAVISDQNPRSVYFAYRGTDLQIEVYDPSPGLARQLVFSGRVRPIG